jgi:LPXTG-site transpeptidase (sortase) family protein
MPRARFAILAGIALALLAVPVVISLGDNLSRRGPSAPVLRQAALVEYNERQTALRRRFGSPDFLESFRAGTIRQGDPVARLIIPRLAVDLYVVEGTSGDWLKAGAGHYGDSALPGAAGNVAIAGHRTSFGEPFRHLDRLEGGDLLHLVTPAGRFTYELLDPFDGHTNPWVTEPLDWSVTGPVEAGVVTLTTAHPPHTAKNRLVARFALVKSDRL